MSASEVALSVGMLDWAPAQFTSGACLDGRMTIDDVARAAHITISAARRAVREHMLVTGGSRAAGRITTADLGIEIDTADKTRAEVSRIIAEHLKLGVFGITHKLQQRGPIERKERRVTARNHPYKVGTKGRSISTIASGHNIAKLTCGCGNDHEIRFRELAGAEQIDRKFIQAGWSVDPARCPTCLHPKKETPMASSAKPSVSAIKSQARMFTLLSTNFDPDAGVYSGDWSDARIAADTGFSIETIAAFRDEAFGPLKEPPAIIQLQADIASLVALLEETVAPIRQELESLKRRVADVRQQFAAKGR